MSAAAEFTHIERTLLVELGLPKKKVREMRGSALVRGTDWQHLGNEVRYSAAGRAKLLAALNAAAPAPISPEHSAPKNSAEPAPCPATTPPPAAAAAHAPEPPGVPQPGEVHELVVIRMFSRNRRIIMARYADRDDVRVRVKDSRKLRAGMALKCSFITGDLWELAQRLPRWPGKA